MPQDEKRLGDLAIKIYEHFLPLFVGTYTAAPYRVGFNQFHPERLLSFLPHELDFTHLRLLWREWKEKAQLSAVRASADTLRAALARPADCANCFTFAAIAFPMRACSPIRWPGWPASTLPRWMERRTTFSGLSSELDELGIVDQRMSFYMPLRLREQAARRLLRLRGALLQPVSQLRPRHGAGCQPAAIPAGAGVSIWRCKAK